MSEKFSSKQEREDAVDSIKDFVHVDKNGKAHVPAGSGRKSGKFLSDHEVAMIEAHSEQIYEGDAAREAQNMLKNTVGVLTDPKDIRESLYVNAYIDDEEYEDLSDDEILQYVADARTEAGYDVDEPQQKKNETTEYSPKHRAEVNNGFAAGDTVTVKRTSGDIESDWQVRTMYGDSVEVAKASPDGNGMLVKLIPIEDMQAMNPRDVAPKHRADAEETPMFDALQRQTTGAALEGESMEEYQDRQDSLHGGAHRADTPEDVASDFVPTPLVDTSRLDAKMRANEQPSDFVPTPLVDISALEQRANNGETNETTAESLSRWRRVHQRLSDLFTGRAALFRLQSSAAERQIAEDLRQESQAQEQREDSERTQLEVERSKNKYLAPAIALGAIAAATLVAFAANKYGVETPRRSPSGGGGSGGAELWSSLAGHTAIPEVQPPTGSGVEHLADAFTIPKGSGGEALMERLGTDKSNWYRIANELLDKFPDTFYERKEGGVGIKKSGMLPNDVQVFISSKLDTLGDKLPRTGA